jgi:hypothetical protein
MIWGAISLLGIIAFYTTLAYQISTRKSGIVQTEDEDVRFVRRWFGLHDGQKVNIEHSYHPTGSWSGDYMKAFAINIDHMEKSEIIQIHGVSSGDKLTPIVRKAVEFVTNFTDESEIHWFPKREQLLSNKYYIYPVRMVIVGQYPDSAHILFIRPEDNMVYYIAVKI